MRFYAGIGSRECPDEVLKLLAKTAYWLSKKGFTLRSGAADGCDAAFEYGCDKANGNKEIFLPWKGFNNSTSELIVKNPKAYEIARKYHPRFDSLKSGAKSLQARNSHQVLGWDLNTPVEFVLCYTKKGKGEGGTGQALRIAKEYNIPIFDFGIYNDINDCRSEFMEFIKQFGIAS